MCTLTEILEFDGRCWMKDIMEFSFQSYHYSNFSFPLYFVDTERQHIQLIRGLDRVHLLLWIIQPQFKLQGSCTGFGSGFLFRQYALVCTWADPVERLIITL